MELGFRKFISEVFVNGKFPKILPSENFPLYGMLKLIPAYNFLIPKLGALLSDVHSPFLIMKCFIPSQALMLDF